MFFVAIFIAKCKNWLNYLTISFLFTDLLDPNSSIYLMDNTKSKEQLIPTSHFRRHDRGNSLDAAPVLPCEAA